VRYYSRRQATNYLREKGVPLGNNRLATLASDGSGAGPRFRYAGKYPLYTEEDLDDWINEWIGEPVRSTTGATVPSSAQSTLDAPSRAARHRPKRTNPDQKPAV
jgi:hypothetical protein